MDEWLTAGSGGVCEMFRNWVWRRALCQADGKEAARCSFSGPVDKRIPKAINGLWPLCCEEEHGCFFTTCFQPDISRILQNSDWPRTISDLELKMNRGRKQWMSQQRTNSC